MHIPLLFLPLLCSATLLPPPKGPHQLSLTNSELIDTSRPDPWGKDVIPYRRLMISRFEPLPLNTPCAHHEEVEYMTPTIAVAMSDVFAQIGIPDGLWSNLSMEFCSQPDDVYKPAPTFPLVLFSPGYNATRPSYNLLAAEIASQGYTVITIDHPYDTTTEFPDGTIALGGNMNLSSPASLNSTLDIRVQDLTFLLNNLSIPANASVLGFGHSFGGAAIAQTMLSDTRIKGGINIDGALFGSVIDSGLSDPKQSFILWGAEGHNRTTDAGWGSFYNHLKDRNIWERELFLRNARHGTFSDLPFIIDFKGIRGNLTAAGVGFAGTVPGERVMEVLRRYLRDYFGFVLRGNEGEGLLSGPSGEFPEVEFLG